LQQSATALRAKVLPYLPVQRVWYELIDDGTLVREIACASAVKRDTERVAMKQKQKAREPG
jgi:hypothetical protein